MKLSKTFTFLIMHHNLLNSHLSSNSSLLQRLKVSLSFSDKPGIIILADHSIVVTSTTPIWSPPYSVPLAHQDAFRLEIENLLSLGIIEPSCSKWSSSPCPIVIDYRKLNSITVHEPFSMPSIDDILSQLPKSTFLSKLDLLKGFHQVPMSETSKEFTAFTCYKVNFNTV